MKKKTRESKKNQSSDSNHLNSDSDFIYAENYSHSLSELSTEHTSASSLSDSDSDEERELKNIYKCSYCSCEERKTLARCRTCNKWFCNNSFTSNNSHIIIHVSHSNHSAISCHPKSKYGEMNLICSEEKCEDDNIFNLYYTKSESTINSGETIKIYCKAHKNSNEKIVRNKMIYEVLERSSEDFLENNTIRITDIEIELLEREWADGNSSSLDSLNLSEKTLERVRGKYLSGLQYRDIFMSLLDQEHRFELKKKLLLDIDEANINVIGNRLRFPLFKKKSIAAEKLRGIIRPGEILIIYPKRINNQKHHKSIKCIMVSLSPDNIVTCKPLDQFPMMNFIGKIEWRWPEASYLRSKEALNKMKDPKDYINKSIFFSILGKENKYQISKKSNQKIEEIDDLTPLNDYQRKTLEGILDKPISLVQGPPGTGKTTLSANLTYNFMKKIKKGNYDDYVLVCAPSNIAVDNIAEKLHSAGIEVTRLYARVNDVRYVDIPDHMEKFSIHYLIGKFLLKKLKTKPKEYSYLKDIYEEAKNNKEYKSKIKVISEFYCLLESIGNKKSLNDPMVKLFSERINKLLYRAAETIIKNYKVICTTCVSSARNIFNKTRFSYVLIDEAAQSTEPESLIPMMHGAKQVVLVGDHYQLPPLINDKMVAKSGMTQSLFERMTRIGMEVNLLRIQYRMHPFLAEFPNKAFYNGILESGVKDIERTKKELSGFFPNPDCPSLFIHVDGNEELGLNGTSYYNLKEVEIVIEKISDLLGRGILAKEIGVITPYDYQKQMLIENLTNKGIISNEESQDIEIASVDAFQGREKEIIIISCVRSNKYKNIGFLNDYRRLNVAITRAKYGMIVIGNAKLLSTNVLWNSFIGYYQLKNIIVNENGQAIDESFCEINNYDEIFNNVKNYVESKRFTYKKINSEIKATKNEDESDEDIYKSDYRSEGEWDDKESIDDEYNMNSESERHEESSSAFEIDH